MTPLLQRLGATGPSFFLFVVVCVIALMVALGLLGRPLKLPGLERGIVDLELAWDSDRATTVVGAWADKSCTGRALWSILIDFPFIVFYTLALILLCLRGGDLLGAMVAWGTQMGHVMASAALVAGLLDVIENGLMVGLLLRHSTDFTVRFTAIAAYGKFGLIGLAVLFSLVALGVTPSPSHLAAPGP